MLDSFFIMAKNEGKKFEENFKNSVPDYCFLSRLNDNAGGFSQNNNLRFTTSNICDYYMFDDQNRILYALELKSTKGTGLTFWRNDFEDKTRKQTFMIKKNQILGLHKASVFKHMVCGFIINFRSVNHTYFVDISNFVRYTDMLDKKSINEQDLVNMDALLIQQTLMRTNYRYSIGRMINNIMDKKDEEVF